MANVPPPLSAKEFFTPEFLKDPYPVYRRYLEGRGLRYIDIHRGVWAVFKLQDTLPLSERLRIRACRVRLPQQIEPPNGSDLQPAFAFAPA
jgi:hypothetical protein